MTPEDINIACAERLGWKRCDTAVECFISPEGIHHNASNCRELPNFNGSLDAAAVLVERAKTNGWRWYAKTLGATFGVAFGRGTDELYRSEESTLSAAICACFLQLPTHA
jgi:hypothetical protein